MPSGRDYANRLLDEAHRAFAPHLSGLQEALRSLQNHLTTSLEQLTPKIEAMKSVEMTATANILSEAIEEVHRQRQQDIAFLAEFGRDLRKKETQEEILSLLLEAAARYAPKVALFLVRDTRFVGWSSRGCVNQVASNIERLSVDKAASPALMRAERSEGMITVPDNAGEAALSECFAAESAHRWNLAPMRALNRTVAVLLALDTNEQRCNTTALQILMDLAALYIECLALRILHEFRPGETPRTEAQAPAVAESAATLEPAIFMTPQAQAPAAAPEIVPQPESSFPVSVPGEAAKQAAETAQAALETPLEPPHTASIAPPEPAAPLQTEVEREVEAMLAEIGKPGPVALPSDWDVIKRAVAPSVSEPGQPSPAEAKIATEEEKQHADARRFARLLVSEIKLYNEQRLIEGRMNRDIYVRLKRDIDKSRETYEKRIPHQVSRKYDYFNDEIVRILAENDPEKLGSDYPGPRSEG